MTKTTNYQLNQWGENDYVKRADFNADNQKIDAAIKAVAEGGVKLAIGSYTGDGKYGQSNPNTLTFASQPKLVFIFGGYTIFAMNPAQRAPTFSSEGADRYYTCHLTWSGNQLIWWSNSSEQYQCNKAGETYHYIALLG